MKRLLLLAGVFALCALAPSCKKSGENAQESVRAHMDYNYPFDNYPFDKKDVFTDDASSDLNEFDQGIKDLSQKVATASQSVQTNAAPKIQDLRNQRTALGRKLDDLKNAKAANWNDLKSDYQKSEEAMKASFNTVSQWLTETTRP